MGRYVACRLVQGPFDGDEGNIPNPPAELWVIDCFCHQARCPGGPHWYDHPVEKGERYLRAAVKDGVLLYLWADPGLPSLNSVSARQRREDLVPA